MINSDMMVQVKDALFSLDRKLVGLFWKETDPDMRHKVRDCIEDVKHIGQYLNHLEEK